MQVPLSHVGAPAPQVPPSRGSGNPEMWQTSATAAPSSMAKASMQPAFNISRRSMGTGPAGSAMPGAPQGKASADVAGAAVTAAHAWPTGDGARGRWSHACPPRGSGSEASQAPPKASQVLVAGAPVSVADGLQAAQQQATASAAMVASEPGPTSTRSAQDLMQEVEELRRARQNANVRQAELIQQVGYEESERLGNLSMSTNLGVLEQEFPSSVAFLEEEVVRERSRSEWLQSELGEATTMLGEMRLSFTELECDNCRLRESLGSLSEALEDPRRQPQSSDEAFDRERSRADQLVEELEAAKAELVDERARANPKGAATSPSGEVEMNSGPYSRGRKSVEEMEVEVLSLRAVLAKRDRELLVATRARRRCADEAERAAASLRAKFAELEAVIAASPSSSSRASSREPSCAPDSGPAVDRAEPTPTSPRWAWLPADDDRHSWSHQQRQDLRP